MERAYLDQKVLTIPDFTLSLHPLLRLSDGLVSQTGPLWWWNR